MTMASHGDDAAPVTVTGTLERIIHRKETDGWSVILVRTDDALTKVTGIVSSPRLGMTVQCSGRYVENSFGTSLKADSIFEVMPSDRIGIEKYLSSGLIKNIGPVYAKKIVAAFGDKTLDILDNDPDRLTEVKGIGKKRLASIVESVKEQVEIRNIMIWLKRYDLTNGLAAKIYMTYGKDSVNKLNENPYRLADDIKGVGFRRADDVALRIGIPRDSAFRIRSGILACLDDAATNGHTYLPKDKLIEKASSADYLSLDRDAVEDAILDGTFDGIHVDGDDVSLPSLSRAEESIAGKLISLLDDRPGIGDVDMRRIERESGLAYSLGQREAIRMACRAGVSIVTGGPGTGKTSVTNAIINEMEHSGKKVLLAAPTGRAAKRMSEVTGHDAKTIHRLLEFGHGGFGRNGENPLDGNVLIVDETSMIDTLLMRSLMNAVPEGMQVVFVGDVDQLPSIGAGCILRDMIDSGIVPTVRLTEIFRQAQDSEIVMNAHRINHGVMPKTGNDIFKGDMFFFDQQDRVKVAATVIRLAAEGVTKKFGISQESIQVLCPMRREGDPIAAAAINAEIQQRLNADGMVVGRRGPVEFRVGDRIMQIRNNYEKLAFNGEIGVVTPREEPDDEKVLFRVDFDGNSVPYSSQDLRDLDLAYACTVHKSQGMEYPVVIIPMHEAQRVMLKRNLLYTAVTRAKQLCILVGSKKAVAMAVHTEDTSKRFTRLKERMHSAKKLGKSEGVSVLEGIYEPSFLSELNMKILSSYGVSRKAIDELNEMGSTVLDERIRPVPNEFGDCRDARVRVSFGIYMEKGRMVVYNPDTSRSIGQDFVSTMEQGRFVIKKPSFREMTHEGQDLELSKPRI